MLFLLFIAYQFAQIIALPFFVIYLLLRARKKAVFGNLKERLGWVPKPKDTNNVIWIHAVSVGETLATEHLVNHIKQQVPGAVCYQTTGTSSGKAMITKNIKADYASFLPFDFLPCMLLAFARIKPHAIIIIEAEQWPNVLMLAHFKNIPVYALSARLSERSFTRFKMFSFIFRPLFSIFSKIFAQTALDATRFKQLGIEENKITVLGDLKAFNVLEKRKSSYAYPRLQAWQATKDKQDQQHTTLLVGSVHPGELEVYIKLFTELKKDFEHIRMILAPRHFHWKADLINQVEKAGFSYKLWDEQHEMTIQNIPDVLKTNDILLVCKLGVLFDLYQFADIFYLGGTFIPVGGHNLLEPAVWANPSFVGPYHINCKATADALEEVGGLIKVDDDQALLSETEKLLRDEPLRTTMGTNNYQWLVREAGLVGRNLENLFNSLKSRK